MSNVKIRNATIHDAPVIVEFLQPFIQAKQLLPRNKEEIEALVPFGFVAELNDVVVGFGAVEIYSTKLAELQCLAVSPDFQLQGIGKRLIEHCVEVARKRGVCELMAITANDRIFNECGFDYSLPNQKRALFIQTQERGEI